ncbi:MAG TPA: hypothetical protein VFF04_07125 [Candidatus Babeliales bacterium]|nr:hypothetical protein [Candidatus Babeliales bacterium]
MSKARTTTFDMNSSITVSSPMELSSVDYSSYIPTWIANPYSFVVQRFKKMSYDIENYLPRLSISLPSISIPSMGSLISSTYELASLGSLAYGYACYINQQYQKGPQWIKTEMPLELQVMWECENERIKLEQQREKLKRKIEVLNKRIEILGNNIPEDKYVKSIAINKKKLSDKIKAIEDIESRMEMNGRKLKEYQQLADDKLTEIETLTFDLADRILNQEIDFHDIEWSQYPGVSPQKIDFLVKSRLALLEVNKSLQNGKSKQRVAYLVPVHKEFNRLKKRSECLTGENFLETKCKQLEWLYRDCDCLEWKVHLYDDQAPHGKDDEVIDEANQSKTRVAPDKEGKIRPCIRRTIDAVDELLDVDGRLARYRDNVECHGYEDLIPQIQSYQDPELRDKDPDSLGNESVKAGAVHLGLRHLAGIEYGEVNDEKVLADVVLMTDADNSIDLSTTGTLLHEYYINDQKFVIGSRRILESVVGNKSGDRHLMSFMFNLLGRTLLNVQVPDTQVGNKLIAIECIPEISGKMHNLTMAFDIELIRAVQDIGVQPKSVPTIWIDSPEESQSSAQAFNMAKGIISIFMRMYEINQTTKGSLEGKSGIFTFTQVSFSEVNTKLIENTKVDKVLEGALRNVLKLANNREFASLIKYSENIYSLMTPHHYRSFINNFVKFVSDLSEGKVDKAHIKELFTEINQLYANTEKSHAIGFAIERFPEIFSVLEVLYHNPEYARVIGPLFLGNSMLGKLLGGKEEGANTYVEVPTFYDYCNKTSPTDLMQAYEAWSQDVSIKIQNVKVNDKVKSIPFQNHDRELDGWQRVALTDSIYQSEISLVMQFDMSAAIDPETKLIKQTQIDYYLKVIREKANELNKGILGKNIKINLIIVDSRGQSERAKDPDNLTMQAIQSIITNSNIANQNVECIYHDLDIQNEQSPGKAIAIRSGMRYALSKDLFPPDAVGYIDFSPKIPIGEMGNLIADVLEGIQTKKPCASVGTRRDTESEVIGKKKEFLYRSDIFNQLVKAFLPELSGLSDTQTGFKLFPGTEMQKVLGNDDESAQLESTSFAFDIELLARLKLNNVDIKERPVPFNDTTELAEATLGPADSMFPDLLRISSRMQKLKSKQQTPTPEKPVFFSNGAEHTVYDIGNGYLLKIESQHVNPNMRLILQHIAFNRTRSLTSKEASESDDLFIMQFNSLLRSRALERYLHLLRENPELNRFVLGFISAWEDKQKSIDLDEVLRRGKGLVGPFSYVQGSFSVTLDGKKYNFDESHRSKVSQKAVRIVKDDFTAILNKFNTIKPDEIETNKDLIIEELKEDVIDRAVALFKEMWARGLFDLDTNIISDLGYFKTESGDKLMSLDPGEMITGIMNVDVERAIRLLDKRSDILLMNAQIKSVINELHLSHEETAKLIEAVCGGVIDYYKSEMNSFFEGIKKEKELVSKYLEANPDKTEQEACLALSEQLSYESAWRDSPDKSEFMMDQIQIDFKPPDPNGIERHSEHTSKLLAAGYNEPYRSDEKLPAPELSETVVGDDQVVLITSHGKEDSTSEKLSEVNQEQTYVAGVDKGSIVPLCDFVSDEIDIEGSPVYKALNDNKHLLSTTSSLFSPSTEMRTSSKPKNIAFVLDAGGGTRTAGMGLASGSKGSIQIGGQTLNDYAIKSARSLMKGLEESGITDYVILTSCDDYFSDSKEHVDALVQNVSDYFQGTPKPGLYWNDLPDGGKNYMPLTVKDTYQFLTSDFMRNEVRDFLSNVLVTRGYVQQGIVDGSFNVLDQLQAAFYEWLSENSQQTSGFGMGSTSQGSGFSLSTILSMGNIFSELMTRYSKLIQWHAMQEKQKISGLKKPFLMIMSKDFFKEFNQLVNKYHDALEAAQETITWENFLLRGLKADKLMWDALKPKQIDASTWSNIFADLQQLKSKHNILDSEQQNQFRAVTATWHNMDDPYAISRAAKEMFQDKTGHVIMYSTDSMTPKTIRLISDQTLPENPPKLISNNDSNVDIISLGCRLDGVVIQPGYLKQSLVSHQYKEDIVMYQLTLEPNVRFQPTMGHVHTQHNGVIYSSPIGPFTKAMLSSQPVFIYTENNGILSAKPLVNSRNEQVTIATFAEYLKSLDVKVDLKQKEVSSYATQFNLLPPLKGFLLTKSMMEGLVDYGARNSLIDSETDRTPKFFESLIMKCIRNINPDINVSNVAVNEKNQELVCYISDEIKSILENQVLNTGSKLRLYID